MTEKKTLPSIDEGYLMETLKGLLNTPSPTGFTDRAVAFLEEELNDYPEMVKTRTRKGALAVTWPGMNAESPRSLTAHVDTLGAVVKEIKPNGRLRLTAVGGLNWNSVEAEGANVFTAGGKAVRGSLMFHKPSMHVYSKEEIEAKRDETTMEVRLDEKVTSAEETRKLGIDVGDFVAFDPRVEVNNNFVRSRHLDDKACAACILSAIKTLHDAGLKPVQRTTILFSNYEEVGHGAAAGIPSDVVELLAVDMAAVGEGQNSDEYHTSICVKDSHGPYHHGMTTRLRRLADAYGIDYRADTYPHYGSDGEAAWMAGADMAVALIGPGVDASHHYERTHIDALIATTRWLMAYLLEE
jgi:putative aminopeptidase FrvX